MSFEISGYYAAYLGILTAILAIGVVSLRAKTGIAWGDGGQVLLQRVIRAHSNLIEYAPIFLILLLVLETAGAPAYALHGLGMVFVASRLVSAVYFWIRPALFLRVTAFLSGIVPIIVGAVLIVTGF